MIGSYYAFTKYKCLMQEEWSPLDNLPGSADKLVFKWKISTKICEWLVHLALGRRCVFGVTGTIRHWSVYYLTFNSIVTWHSFWDGSEVFCTWRNMLGFGPCLLLNINMHAHSFCCMLLSEKRICRFSLPQTRQNNKWMNTFLSTAHWDV